MSRPMTFIKVFDKLDRYRPDRKVRPWILTIAHNTALKTMRLPVKTVGSHIHRARKQLKQLMRARLDSDPTHTPV